LFVAALGNNTVEVISLTAGTVVQSIPGLKEPQGVVYLPDVDRLFVANGGDGTVRIFDGSTFKLLKSAGFQDDADNLRYDQSEGLVYVGYGGGGLGVLDKEGAKVADFKLASHPESFRLGVSEPRIFVNLPNSLKIAVLDRKSGKLLTSWGTGGPLANYPMALDEADHRLLIVTRIPARLVALDTTTGKVVQSVPTVGDCDDVFYDAKRRRVYLTGGEGAIGVYQQRDADHYDDLGRINTQDGARTSFLSPELDQFYVAAPRRGSRPAEIRVYGVKD